MGWYFRRSLNLGPLRLNLSRRGVGWSVGGRGLRVGESADKRGYTRASIPGTGIGWRGPRGCLLVLLPPLVLLAALLGSAALALTRAA